MSHRQDKQVVQQSGAIVRQEVEKLLMAMQFQDRVSQILGAVDDDMARMRTALETSAPDALPDAQAWLATFSKSYTMADQHHRRA